MKQISKMSALELQQEIERAEFYAEDSGPELMQALKEVQRLREISYDIIDIINTSRLPEDQKVVEIEDIAQRYFDG